MVALLAEPLGKFLFFGGPDHG
jgi:hypothetical protein